MRGGVAQPSEKMVASLWTGKATGSSEKTSTDTATWMT